MKHRPEKRQKCVKSRSQDVVISLEEDIQWGEAMDNTERVLVGRVSGRNYTVVQLKQWVAEICRQHLAELPFVQAFIRG